MKKGNNQPHLIIRGCEILNLVYSAKSSDVHTVICNGQMLLHNHELLTLDKDLIKREVARRLDRLSTRVPGRKIATYPS